MKKKEEKREDFFVLLKMGYKIGGKIESGGCVRYYGCVR
jgi:hypothetical protein